MTTNVTMMTSRRKFSSVNDLMILIGISSEWKKKKNENDSMTWNS